MKKIAVLTTCIFMLLSYSAMANTFWDPDDMTSPLDIRRVVHRDKGGDVHLLKIVTDDNW
ncbi:MAG: hypothetical protein QOH90_2423, partial [Actinomycetota bacterium]|nr:hypothetical protein [Actinomycetota bacterium]